MQSDGRYDGVNASKTDITSSCCRAKRRSPGNDGTRRPLTSDVGASTLSSVRIRLPIKVIAGSSWNGIAGWLGDTLRVRVTAPAERGRANAAVEALLKDVLDLTGSDAKIVLGGSSPRKVVEIIGLSESEVRRRLSDAAN